MLCTKTRFWKSPDRDALKSFLSLPTLWPPQLSPLRPTAVDLWWWWTSSWTPAPPSSGFRKPASASWSPATLVPKPACGWPVGSSLQRYSCCIWRNKILEMSRFNHFWSWISFKIELKSLPTSTLAVYTPARPAPGCSSALWLSVCFLKAPEVVPSCQRCGEPGDWREGWNRERERARRQSRECRGERHHLAVSHSKYGIDVFMYESVTVPVVPAPQLWCFCIFLLQGMLVTK